MTYSSTTLACSRCGRAGFVETIGGYALCPDCLIAYGQNKHSRRLAQFIADLKITGWLSAFFISCLLVVPGLVLGIAITAHDWFESKQHNFGMPLDGPAMLVLSLLWLAILIGTFMLFA